MSDGLSKLQKVIVSDATGLVIDDDKSVCDLVSRLMVAMEFKQVLTASNGADGLKIAAECKPTVIVCDVDMSPIDGVMFVAGIRFSLDIGLQKTPVIIFSAHPNKDIVQTLKGLGVKTFITKPFILTLFSHRINEAIEMSFGKNGMELNALRWQFGDDAYSDS
jgi:CheY-like chemotaxis protein